MNTITDKTFDAERALYGSDGIHLINCEFDGPADGESALKESRDIIAENCYFNLRYPFWHDVNLQIKNSRMTELCRAAVWYSENIDISGTQMNGIKALRECRNVKISGCGIISPEFGWSVKDIFMENTSAQSEYFMLRSENLEFKNVKLEGKYSFQYIENAVFENCEFTTKDAFWHAKNVTVKNSVINGEYLAWYSDGLVLENCKIKGTQPFCYCKNLKLVNCEMIDADLCFEKSDVEASITSPVISIKNPSSGIIKVKSFGEYIHDDKNSKAVVLCAESVQSGGKDGKNE